MRKKALIIGCTMVKKKNGNRLIEESKAYRVQLREEERNYKKEALEQYRKEKRERKEKIEKKEKIQI